MRGRRQAPDGLRVFEERVLETTAGTEERAPGLAGNADGGQRAGRVRVRAGRHAPDSAERAEVPGDVRTEIRRMHPYPFDADARLGGRLVESRGDRPMCDDRWVVVADERDTALVLHLLAAVVVSLRKCVLIE